MSKIMENVLGYCSDCGEAYNDLTVIETQDDNNSIALCSSCIDELVGKLTDRTGEEIMNNSKLDNEKLETMTSNCVFCDDKIDNDKDCCTECETIIRDSIKRFLDVEN